MYAFGRHKLNYIALKVYILWAHALLGNPNHDLGVANARPCFKLLYYSLKEHVERSDEEMFKVHSASQKDKQILSAATTQTHIGAPLQTESVGSLNSHWGKPPWLLLTL